MLLLLIREDVNEIRFSIPYLTLVPLLLFGGVFSSIRSIPLIEERNDKDYAYSGLILNILFMCGYILSLIYFFSYPSH